jgi:hypothetical protein
LEEALWTQQKSLKFEEEEIENLLETKYQNRGVFSSPFFALPWSRRRPRVSPRPRFPKSRFTQRKLSRVGVPADEIPLMLDRIDRLPNLQLLEGTANRAKGTLLPSEYVKTQVPAKRRRRYVEFHDLEPLPEDELGFLEFYDRRRETMKERLIKILT